MQPCKALTPEAGSSAADALKADTPNRGGHIECQQLQLSLLHYVLNLIQHGRIGPIVPAVASSSLTHTAPAAR